MSDDFFQMEMPDLDGFIRELDLLNEQVSEAVREGMHEGAEIVAREQRAEAAAAGIVFVADYIDISDVYSSQRGSLGISTGFMPRAFEQHDGKQPGVVGLTYEFGRPGQSRNRSRDTMYQTRNGKTFRIKKGRINPRPFLRPGFDRKTGEASQKIIDCVTKKLERVLGK